MGSGTAEDSSSPRSRRTVPSCTRRRFPTRTSCRLQSVISWHRDDSLPPRQHKMRKGRRVSCDMINKAYPVRATASGRCPLCHKHLQKNPRSPFSHRLCPTGDLPMASTTFTTYPITSPHSSERVGNMHLYTCLSLTPINCYLTINHDTCRVRCSLA
jgi:hypothetical protein